MKLVIQRVLKADVIINKKIYSSIDKGILLLTGFEADDQQLNFDYYIKKIVNLRIFNDINGKMNKSLLDTNGSILVVSQFTLLADINKGNRPSFIKAAKPDLARDLYNQLIKKLKNYEINIEQGRFGAQMFLDFINDGPVTIIMDSKK
tara:strand:- start:729 stop:1172 length:444 start_codon:yes stop_codon:yes gene_type:complete